MLYELGCDKFMAYGKPRNMIRFQPGLNTILGGRSADNSIGKSTFLLIIDYAFGGDFYAKEADITDHIGDHLIKFAFQFNNQLHYFSRGIVQSRKVNICDADYHVQKTISIDDFRKFLLTSYAIKLSNTSFRNIVGRYMRIFPKGNYNSTAPLEAHPREKVKDSIKSLEELFDVYWKIEQYQEEVDHLQETKSAYSKALKYGIITSVVTRKQQYEENQQKIEELTQKISNLILRTDRKISADEVANADKISTIKGKITSLKRKRSYLKSQLSLLKINTQGQTTANEQDITKLKDFFPSVNIKRLSEIENFHRKMSYILNSELEEESVRFQGLIQSLSTEISALEDSERKLGNTVNIPKHIFDDFSNLQKQISDLTKQNDIYAAKRKFSDDIKIAKKNLLHAEYRQLESIKSEINTEMVHLNDYIYHDTHHAPVLDFFINKKDTINYRFYTPEDTGTGTSYKSLIIFDLAILKLTPLPVLVHDSLILNDIGDGPLEKIFELYQIVSKEMDKQIFIAFDREQAPTNKMQHILNQTAVIHLSSSGNELFGRNWSK